MLDYLLLHEKLPVTTIEEELQLGSQNDEADVIVQDVAEKQESLQGGTFSSENYRC